MISTDKVRVNLGSGNVYMPGWVNVDFNTNNKVDINCDLTKEVPFVDNSVDEILLDNVLEHIQRDRYFWFMDELWRICKPGAVIKIYVPHCSNVGAFGHPAHYNYFHSWSLNVMSVDVPKNYERYNSARFKIKSKVLFFHHNYFNLHFLSRINPYVSWIFNGFGETWKMICERVLKFEECYYVLEVKKC